MTTMMNTTMGMTTTMMETTMMETTMMMNTTTVAVAVKVPGCQGAQRVNSVSRSSHVSDVALVHSNEDGHCGENSRENSGDDAEHGCRGMSGGRVACVALCRGDWWGGRRVGDAVSL